jgi:hypothetical protein
MVGTAQFHFIFLILVVGSDCACVRARARVCVSEFLTGPTVQPTDYRPVNRKHYENWQQQTEALGEEPDPAPLCPSQIPHGLHSN